MHCSNANIQLRSIQDFHLRRASSAAVQQALARRRMLAMGHYAEPEDSDALRRRIEPKLRDHAHAAEC